MTEKAEEKVDIKKSEEEEDSEKKILKAIDEKYKDNLTIKLKLLALFHYSQIENENSEKMEKEIGVLSHKFKKLSLPLIHKVNDIVNGKKLEAEDIHNYQQYLDTNEADKKDEIISKEPKQINDYWLKVLKANFVLKEEIKQHDEEPLKALRRIEYVPSEDPEKPHDFSLKFHFAPNDYFENDIVIKEFQMEDEREAKKTECTEIKWKSGKNVTKTSVKKKQKNKKTGQSRTVTKEVDQESFFTFFRNMENKEHGEDDDDDDEEAEESDHIDRHVDIAMTIVEEILAYSSEYYLGVRKEADFDFLKDQILNKAGGDEEEGDNDDDEDVGGKKGKKKKGNKPGNAGAGAGGDKQECKQQ